MKKRTQSNQPTSFLQKTYDLLEQKSHQDSVSWTQDGTGFVIKDPTQFSQKILPMYFKHSNLASFVRQLNMYDFHKCRTSGSNHIFKHPLFIRGRSDLLVEIKRKTSDQNWPIVPFNSESRTDLSPLLQKLYQLHKKSSSNQNRISVLQDTINDLSQQKTTLIEQLWETRQRTQRIEHVLMLLVGYLRDNRKDIPTSVIRENFLSITQNPQNNSEDTDDRTFEELLKSPPQIYMEMDDVLDEEQAQIDLLREEEYFDFLLDNDK